MRRKVRSVGLGSPPAPQSVDLGPFQAHHKRRKGSPPKRWMRKDRRRPKLPEKFRRSHSTISLFVKV